MVRPYRLHGENCFYHIMSRGNDRRKIFARYGDYIKFMEFLKTAKERYAFFLYAYCLMPNHFHLLLETQLPNISTIMHFINGSYTVYYNTRHQRHGHLFQGRYKSIVVEKDSYFLELSRYIHLNPLRAGVVRNPEDYIWSSYRGYLGKKDAYIDRDQVQYYLGMNWHQYRQFVLAGINKSEDPLRKVYAGFLLGSVEFIKRKLQDIDTQHAGEDIAHKKVLHDDEVRSQDVIRAVTNWYGVTLDEVRKSRKRPNKPKQVLVYLLRKYTGYSNKTIGDIVAMRHSAVSKAGLYIECLMESDNSMNQEIKKIISNFEG